MSNGKGVSLPAFIVVCLILTGYTYFTYHAVLWTNTEINAILYGPPPCFEPQVDDIIKRLSIDMEVFKNVDRELFHVENLGHLTMTDLDKLDLSRTLKCRLLEHLHALVFVNA